MLEGREKRGWGQQLRMSVSFFIGINQTLYSKNCRQPCNICNNEKFEKSDFQGGF